jgi:hypothetical protein
MQAARKTMGRRREGYSRCGGIERPREAGLARHPLYSIPISMMINDKGGEVHWFVTPTTAVQ